MKSEALKTWLDQQAKILETVCDCNAAKDLSKLATVFAARPTATVGQICTLLNKLKLPNQSKATTLNETSALVRLIVKAATGIAKSGDARDLKQFADLVHSQRHLALDQFVEAAIETLQTPPATRRRASPTSALGDSDIHSYAHRLEVALGDEPGFDEVYSALATDKRVKAADAKKIAKAFTGKAGSSKADAMGRIHRRHTSLMSSRPKLEAIGGRSAA